VEDVGGLHRSRIGSLGLPVDLKAGEWRWLTLEDMANISAKT
jgi:16S rRNA pseudouridine516 synthase